MAVSDAQFGNYMLSRQDRRDPEIGTTSYHLWRQQNTLDPAEAVGRLDVYHRNPKAYTGYAGPVGLQTSAEMDPEMQQRGFNETWAKQQAPKHGGQIPLFQHESGRPRSEVNGLFMTEDARHMASTMIGVAAEHTLQERGRILESSTNLSSHSERVVEHLQGIGVVPEGQQRSHNTITWAHPTEASVGGGLEGVHATLAGSGPEDDESIVPLSDVRAGQGRMRKLLGGRRQSSMGAQESMFDSSRYDREET